MFGIWIGIFVNRYLSVLFEFELSVLLVGLIVPWCFILGGLFDLVITRT